MVKDLICINCPMGCRLKVDTETLEVQGNTCKRGVTYGVSEITNPVRTVTSTVKVQGGELPVVSVKTKSSVAKDLNFKIMELLKDVELKAPVHIGDVVVENVFDTGVDVIATKTVKGTC